MLRRGGGGRYRDFAESERSAGTRTVGKLRHFVGQRLDDLAALVNEGGPFSVEGKGVASLLAEFRHQEGLRTMLAHGQARLTVERTSRWAAIFRVIAIRARQADRSTPVIEENEAAGRLQKPRKV